MKWNWRFWRKRKHNPLPKRWHNFKPLRFHLPPDLWGNTSVWARIEAEDERRRLLRRRWFRGWLPMLRRTYDRDMADLSVSMERAGRNMAAEALAKERAEQAAKQEVKTHAAEEGNKSQNRKRKHSPRKSGRQAAEAGGGDSPIGETPQRTSER